jgi:hypothetical protein
VPRLARHHADGEGEDEGHILPKAVALVLGEFDLSAARYAVLRREPIEGVGQDV